MLLPVDRTLGEAWKALNICQILINTQDHRMNTPNIWDFQDKIQPTMDIARKITQICLIWHNQQSGWPLCDPSFKLVGECVKASALIIFCIVGTQTRPVSYTLSWWIWCIRSVWDWNTVLPLYLVVWIVNCWLKVETSQTHSSLIGGDGINRVYMYQCSVHKM